MLPCIIRFYLRDVLKKNLNVKFRLQKVKMGPNRLSRNVVKNYHYTLPILGGGNLRTVLVYHCDCEVSESCRDPRLQLLEKQYQNTRRHLISLVTAVTTPNLIVSSRLKLRFYVQIQRRSSPIFFK